MEPTKKFSFGFSKVKKLSNLVKPVAVEKEEVQYVDSFDGEKGKFSFQGNTREEEVKKKLVIPLVGTKSAYDVIKAKLDLKNGASEKTIGPVESEIPTDNPISVVEAEENDIEPSLESLAAREILENLKNAMLAKKPTNSGLVIVTDTDKPVFKGEEESTLDDYESVPIGDFGLALLRGMGWQEDTGIGKESKVVAPVTSTVRPKRLGLGAEGSKLESSVDVPINKGNFVKVLGGPFKGSYGVVEAVDGDIGRAFVKLEEEGTVSLSENVITVVTKKEFEQRNEAADAKKEADDKVKVEKNWKYGINVPTQKESRPVDKEDSKRSINEERSPVEGKYRQERDRQKPTRNSKSWRNEEHVKIRCSPRRERSGEKKRDSSSDSEGQKRKAKSSRRSLERRTRDSQERRHLKEKPAKKRYSSTDSDKDGKIKEHKQKYEKASRNREGNKRDRSSSPEERSRTKEKVTRKRRSSTESESPPRKKKSKKDRSRSKERRDKVKKSDRSSAKKRKKKDKNHKKKRVSSSSNDNSE